MRSDEVLTPPAPPPPPAPTDPVVLSSSSPFTVAAIRAVLTALLAGATTFLATWSQTDNPKQLIIATASAIISILVVRLGLEGTIDTARAEHAKAAALRVR